MTHWLLFRCQAAGWTSCASSSISCPRGSGGVKRRRVAAPRRPGRGRGGGLGVTTPRTCWPALPVCGPPWLLRAGGTRRVCDRRGLWRGGRGAWGTFDSPSSFQFVPRELMTRQLMLAPVHACARFAPARAHPDVMSPAQGPPSVQRPAACHWLPPVPLFACRAPWWLAP
jgi:hypothetical protein